MTSKQINKFCDWVIVRFGMQVTNKHYLQAWFKNPGYGKMCWRLKRFKEYREKMAEMGVESKYIYRNRWYKFIENMEHFESDEALERKLDYIKSINQKEKSIEEILEENKLKKKACCGGS